MKTATYEELDYAMYKWLQNARHNNIPISLVELAQKKGLRRQNS